MSTAFQIKPEARNLALLLVVCFVAIAYSIGGIFIDTKNILLFSGIVGGIAAIFMLFYEAKTTKRGTVAEVCLYASGFIMFSEFIVFISLLIKTTTNH